MIRTVRNVALATAIFGTCATAGTVTAPNSIDIEVSGDVELKFKKDKTQNSSINTNDNVDYRTAELNLYIDAKMDNGLEFHFTGLGYDDTQANSNADTGVRTKEAYAVVPFLEGKAKLIAGLKENVVYGTDAFENGGEAWRAAFVFPIAQGITGKVVSKIENEEEQDSNKGDSGGTVLRVDGKFGDINAGLRYAALYANKNDGQTAVSPADREKEIDLYSGYIMGEASGVEFSAEYMKTEIEMVGASNQPKDQSGYFLSAGMDVMENLNAGLAYVSLSDGLKGGEDFAPGLILDGNVDSLGENLDTTAIVLPITYSFNDSLSATFKYIHAEIEDGNAATKDDAREIDLGVEYVYNENLTISATIGDYDHSDKTQDDITSAEVVMAITF